MELKTIIKGILNENSNDELKKLRKQLKDLDEWFFNHTYGKEGHELWAEKEEEAVLIRKKLKELTGDLYGRSKEEKEKINVKPKGLHKRYDHPADVPKEVYRWIFKRMPLLTSDATDAVRWSRIINSKNDARYSESDITIYRAVDNLNYNDIREGDWVTTDENYAVGHNKRYFDGKGKVISMDVNGEDVLLSPTGNYEEAIYAPLEYSIDVKL